MPPTADMSSPDASEAPVLGAWATVRDLLGMLGRYRFQMVLFGFAMLIEVGYDAVLPLCMKWLIDFAIEPRSLVNFFWILGGMAGAFLIATAGAVWQDYLYGWLGANALHDLRLRLFQHIQRL